LGNLFLGGLSLRQEAQGLLRKLAREERFRLRVIGAESIHMEGVEVEGLPWRASTEVADLSAMDIGIMPLPDNGWTRGKCGMKALQYMSLGIPAVCSPVGVNSSIIRDGENGFVASTEEEWVERLTRLLRSPSLRARLGAAGRLTVEAGYSASVHAPRVHEILKSVVRRERVGDSAVKAYSSH
jgi:glycosyltransferase involved in cell wall biosynthesis